MSSRPFSCPFTGTSTSTFPSGRSGSVITTLIGPSTFVPGVTSTSPVVGLISAGTLFPSSSVAVTLVSLSGFSTLIPVPCFSSVGSTGVIFEVSTLVLVLLSSCPALCPFTGTSNVCLPFGKSSSVTVTLIGPSTFVPGVTTMLPFSSILAGTFFPSSSTAVTVVVSSGFLTTKPVFCSSSFGFTGVAVPVT